MVEEGGSGGRWWWKQVAGPEAGAVHILHPHTGSKERESRKGGKAVTS